MNSTVLALDPSFRNTGYAIIELTANAEKVIETGVIKTEKNDKTRKVRAADQRLEQIQVLVTGLRTLIAKHKPAMMVAELPSSGAKSANAAAAMAIAQAVCGAVVVYENLPYEWVTPTENKKALAGKKNASKEEMMEAAVRLYPALRAKYTHQKGQYKGRLVGEFEHIADALGTLEVIKSNSPLIRMIRP